MSRSFKRSPILKYDGMGKFGKRLLRHSSFHVNGRSYRKLYDSYNIRDIVITYWYSEDRAKSLRK